MNSGVRGSKLEMIFDSSDGAHASLEAKDDPSPHVSVPDLGNEDKNPEQGHSSELKSNPSPPVSEPNPGDEDKNPEQVRSSKNLDPKSSELRRLLSRPCGGIAKCKTSCPYVKAAARFAVKAYKKAEGKPFKLKRIVAAKVQLVNGNLYHLTLEEKNGCFYKVRVCMYNTVRGDSLLVFKPAKMPKETN